MKPKSRKKIPASLRRTTTPRPGSPAAAAPVAPAPTVATTTGVTRSMDLFKKDTVRPPLTCRSRYPAERLAPFRPFRQSPPRNLLLHREVAKINLLKVLVCGVGDLGSVARTACDAAARDARADLSFITNDAVPEILARNMLILNALATSRVEEERIAGYVAQLWFSLTMQPDARAFWDAQMRQCINTDWANLSADAPVRTQSQETIDTVRHCWRSWLKVNWSVETLFAKRNEFLGESESGSNGEDGEFSRIFESKLQVSDRPAPVVNPTMLLIRDNGEPYYAIDATARPLAMFDDPDVHANPPETVMRETVREWTATMRRMMSGSKPQLHVVSLLGHAVTMMEELQGDVSMGFDAIDVGNLCDTCGLLTVLVHAAALLNRFRDSRPRTLIYAYTKRMVEAGAASADEFVAAATGLAYEAFPALLGIGLVEKPFDDDWTTWVQRSLPSTDQRTTQITFYGILAAAVPTSLANSPFLTDALNKCMAHLNSPESLDFHFKTDSLRSKMLAYALAWGRIVFEGAQPCQAPPLHSPSSNAGRLDPPTIPKTFEVSEQVASSLLYGLPVAKLFTYPDGDYLSVIDIALNVPADSHGNALVAVGPSHLVLEITSPECPAVPIRIENLRAKLTEETPPRLHVVAFVPQVIAADARRPGAMRLYREFLPPHRGGPSPSPQRELLGGRPLPRHCILPSEIPFHPFYVCLRGLITRVNDCRDIDPAGPRAFPMQLPVMHVAEARDEVKLVLALPPHMASVSLALPAKDVAKKHLGAAVLVVNGRPQIMRLSSPVRIVKVQAARKQGHVTLILERVMGPDKELGVVPYAKQHSDRMVLHPRDDAFVRAVQAARDAAPNPQLRWSTAFPLSPTPSPDELAAHSAALLLELFEAYARGTRIVELRVEDWPRPVGLFVLYDSVLVPAQGPGMAPTPGLRAALTLFAGVPGSSVASMELATRVIEDFVAAEHPGAVGNDAFLVTLEFPAGQTHLLASLFEHFCRPHDDRMASLDARFDGRTIRLLRPALVPVLILPLCKIRGVREEDEIEVIEGQGL
ncbi:hypothetical protein H9P43_005900 [Blastocladiella emersonii ATCC 22665]|nr:hypothetical protein H9P43_005900 [Blastocladiella emersonii ATCC 22665]